MSDHNNEYHSTESIGGIDNPSYRPLNTFKEFLELMDQPEFNDGAIFRGVSSNEHSLAPKALRKGGLEEIEELVRFYVDVYDYDNKSIFYSNE
jgi:hypothetical protein